jgi:hypothetical protein
MKKILTFGTAVLVVLLTSGCPNPSVTPVPGEQPSEHKAASIKGAVIDTVTGEPVVGVTVSFAGARAVTDAGGRFSLDLGIDAGTLRGSWSVHKEGYQFSYLQELSVDASRNWEISVPTQRCDRSAYGDRGSVFGKVYSAPGIEVPLDSKITVFLFSASGAFNTYANLRYDGQYTFSTPISCADCLLAALVEPVGGGSFVAMVQGLNLTGAAQVRQDVTAPVSGYTDLLISPSGAGNVAGCSFVTKYGLVPAFFSASVPTTTWRFSTAAPASVGVFNPFGWNKVAWTQIEVDSAFHGLPLHVKEFISTSTAGDLSSSVSLPAPDHGLGPTGCAEPESLAYANGVLSLNAVAGAGFYAYTMRAGSAAGDILGTVVTRNSAAVLPGWLLKIMSGHTVHLCFDVMDCVVLPQDPLHTGVQSSTPITVGRVRGNGSSLSYEKLLSIPAVGSAVIGLE